MRSENKQLLKQLEQEQQSGGHKEREMAQLHQQLQLQTHNHQQLVEQVPTCACTTVYDSQIFQGVNMSQILHFQG